MALMALGRSMASVAFAAFLIFIVFMGQTKYCLLFIMVIIVVPERFERPLVHLASSTICGMP